MRFDWKNLHLPTATDFNDMESFGDSSLKKRTSDFYSWGIVKNNDFPGTATPIPVSGLNPFPNLNPRNLEFSVQFNADAGTLDIGAGSSTSTNVAGGIAYDLNGNRIYIPNDITYSNTVDIPEGKKSSGNRLIPLPGVGTTTYVWIEYLEVNDTSFQKIKRDGVITYPKILDGYRIRLTTNDPNPPSGDGLSIFLAKVVWTTKAPVILNITPTQAEESDTQGNLVSGIPSASTSDPKRVYATLRQQNVEILPASGEVPASYAFGQRLTLKDHVNAVGSAAPTPNNPHGLTLADIPGANLEPLATSNQSVSLSKGIVDLTIAQNSPNVQSTALATVIKTQTLDPDSAQLDATALVGTGIPTSGSQAQYVEVSTFAVSQYAYLTGKQHTSVYPTLAQTTNQASSATPDNGWIGFASTDQTGIYALFGSAGTVGGVNKLFLRKVLVPGSSNLGFSGPIPDINSIPPLPDLFGDRLLLGYVYWSGTNLYRDYLQTSSMFDLPVEDSRSLGVVGPKQLSTELKGNADTGGLANQRLENLVGNSSFLFNKSGGQFPGWTIVDSAFLLNASIVRKAYTDSGFGDLANNGANASPASLSGVLLTPTAGSTTGTTRMYGQLANLKPNTYYSLSFNYRTLTSQLWNSRVRLGINDNNTGTQSSVIINASNVGLPIDMTIVNDASWHRTNVVVKTTSTVTPASTYYLELRLDAPLSTPFPAGAQDSLLLTNFQVTEGEWVTGYSDGSRSVPSGAIILWDKSTSCPPGFSEVTAMVGRLPIAANTATGTNGMQTPGTAVGQEPATDGLRIGSHDHNLQNAGKGAAASSDHVMAADRVPWTDTNGFDSNYRLYGPATKPTEPAGTHSAIPGYTVLFCRAL